MNYCIANCNVNNGVENEKYISWVFINVSSTRWSTEYMNICIYKCRSMFVYVSKDGRKNKDIIWIYKMFIRKTVEKLNERWHTNTQYDSKLFFN